MRKLERLRKEALAACEYQGHKMKRFDRRYRYWWSSECKICGKTVHLNVEPHPLAAEIYGEAVALECGD